MSPRLHQPEPSPAGCEAAYRSIANMVEVMIRDYCRRNGVTIPEQAALFHEGVRTPPRRS